MNSNRSGLFWGILLVGAGMLALARQLGYIDDSLPLVWMGIFAVVSFLALVYYALSGWRQWAWLFPAGAFGGLAVTIALASADLDTSAVASPLFFGLILPFAAAYLTDRARNWWALIPGGMMVFLALVTLLAGTTAGDEWIGAFFLFMIVASFLFVYLGNRTRLWALLVAYIVGVLGIAPLMSIGGRDADLYGAIFLFAVALPFFFVYLRYPEHWWAIIPAGTMTTLAVIVGLSITGAVPSEWEERFMTALLMAGLAATFAVLWLRHGNAWAKVVTLGLAAVGVAAIFFGNILDRLWPVAIIAAGIYLFYTALRPKAV